MSGFFTHCESCGLTVHCIGEPDQLWKLFEENTAWRHALPCVKPLCYGRAKRVGIVDAKPPIHGTPAEIYYRALNGIGSIFGAPAKAEEVVQALLTKRIVEVLAEPVGQPERTIVRRMTLEDGTRLHFESSDRGACIYYLEAKIEGAPVSPEGDSAGGGSDRAEARPAPFQGQGSDHVEAHGMEG